MRTAEEFDAINKLLSQRLAAIDQLEKAMNGMAGLTNIITACAVIWVSGPLWNVPVTGKALTAVVVCGIAVNGALSWVEILLIRTMRRRLEKRYPMPEGCK